MGSVRLLSVEEVHTDRQTARRTHNSIPPEGGPLTAVTLIECVVYIYWLLKLKLKLDLKMTYLFNYYLYNRNLVQDYTQASDLNFRQSQHVKAITIKQSGC